MAEECDCYSYDLSRLNATSLVDEKARKMCLQSDIWFDQITEWNLHRALYKYPHSGVFLHAEFKG